MIRQNPFDCLKHASFPSWALAFTSTAHKIGRVPRIHVLFLVNEARRRSRAAPDQLALPLLGFCDWVSLPIGSLQSSARASFDFDFRTANWEP